MTHHSYTQQQIDWLRKHRPEMLGPTLTKEFNAAFDTDLSISALRGTCKRHGFYASTNGQFVAGHIPHNAGVKGRRVSMDTEFKKGNVPKNTLPVGTELDKGDGYIWVKIAEPREWRQKHRLIWRLNTAPNPKVRLLFFWMAIEQTLLKITCNCSRGASSCSSITINTAKLARS